MIRKKVWLILFGVLFIAKLANGQEVNKKVLNWYNGKKLGMSTDLAYDKILSTKKATTVIVAVIDSGVDIEHEDLKDNIWVNTDEIPNNGIDDDKNGYVDDINGWNFLGNAEGENINDVRLEATRLYAELKEKYDGKNYPDLSKEQKEEYKIYKKVKDEVTEARLESENELKDLTLINDELSKVDKILKEQLGDNYTIKQLKKARKDSRIANEAKQMYSIYKYGITYNDIYEEYKYYFDNINFNYNPAINPRQDVIGDDPTDFKDNSYGNNDVIGPDASHGTHCAGIIGATRNNGIGNDGVANQVKLMSVRTVPNGDEWDKDVALAVRYAVDNGAQVISMSFGKSYSPQQKGVIEAFRYAEEKGVLLVHAAGNEGLDIDENENYPRPKYESMEMKFNNWIEVGASTRHKKPKYFRGTLFQNGIAADFSNYGDQMVDIYAPGEEIFSTTPENTYDAYDGTSMAGPMVAGLAALLKSYYPEFSMLEIRKIILESVQKTNTKEMPLPGDSSQKVTLDQLCVTGGIANVYNAVLMAEEKLKSNH